MQIRMMTNQVRQVSPGSYASEMVESKTVIEVTDEQGSKLIEAGKAVPVTAKSKPVKKGKSKKTTEPTPTEGE